MEPGENPLGGDTLFGRGGGPRSITLLMETRERRCFFTCTEESGVVGDAGGEGFGWRCGSCGDEWRDAFLAGRSEISESTFFVFSN